MRSGSVFALIGIIALGFLVIGPFAMAQNPTSEDFVKKVSVGNEFEIQSSKLALDRSKNKDVQAFAKRMVDDHGKAGKNFTKAVAASSVSSKLASKTLDEKHQEILDKLKEVSEDEFDKEYIAAQTEAHDETVALFRSYSENGEDASLKNFAAKTLPTLEKHQDEVHKLAD